MQTATDLLNQPCYALLAESVCAVCSLSLVAFGLVNAARMVRGLRAGEFKNSRRSR